MSCSSRAAATSVDRLGYRTGYKINVDLVSQSYCLDTHRPAMSGCDQSRGPTHGTRSDTDRGAPRRLPERLLRRADWHRQQCDDCTTGQRVRSVGHCCRQRVIYTQQIYDPGRLTPRQQRSAADNELCIAGTTGADLFIAPVAGAGVAHKDRYDIWSSAEFGAILEDWNIDGLSIGGVALQCCVLYAVLGADERGYDYAVPQDLISGIDECDETSNRAVRD